MTDLFDGITRTEYVIENGIKIPYSDFNRPPEYYDALRGKTYTGDEYAGLAKLKDNGLALYDRRWQSAKAVIDLVAKEIDIDPEKTPHLLYGLYQDKGEFSSPLVDKMRTWFDKSGDKAKLKKRVAELEAQLDALRSALKIS